jgi:hypothetical protein
MHSDKKTAAALIIAGPSFDVARQMPPTAKVKVTDTKIRSFCDF